MTNMHKPVVALAVGGWASISIGRNVHDGREPPPALQYPGQGLNFVEQWRHIGPLFVNKRGSLCSANYISLFRAMKMLFLVGGGSRE